MKYYTQIPIIGLEKLQEEVLEIIGPYLTVDNFSNFSYQWSDQLKRLPTFVKNLMRLKLYQDIVTVGIITMPPHTELQIHHDTVGSKYSLNIPIQNTKGTYTMFYATQSKPVEQNHGNILSQSYWYYDQNNCVEKARIEMNQPYLIDVSVPHNAINPTDKTRIVLLVRLNSNISV